MEPQVDSSFRGQAIDRLADIVGAPGESRRVSQPGVPGTFGFPYNGTYSHLYLSFSNQDCRGIGISMSDMTFGSWSAGASPLNIEYSLVVIEEIRHEVAEGFQK